VRKHAELLLWSPARFCSQLDSLGAENFGHVPEGFVEFEIFVNAFDGPALRHPASVGSAARVVPLTTTDDVFLNLCGASRYVEQPVTAASVAR
jgi:hypothetical protein